MSNEISKINWNKIKVEDGVPITSYNRRISKYQRLYDFVESMKIGQSALIPVKGTRLQSVLQTAFPHLKIVTRTTAGGTRIYKLEKGE